MTLPAQSPNLNAYAERWVRSVKEECLSRVILFGERSLRRALSDYVDHFHAERNHQGKGNVLLSPRAADRQPEGPAAPLACLQRSLSDDVSALSQGQESSGDRCAIDSDAVDLGYLAAFRTKAVEIALLVPVAGLGQHL